MSSKERSEPQWVAPSSTQVRAQIFGCVHFCLFFQVDQVRECNILFVSNFNEFSPVDKGGDSLSEVRYEILGIFLVMKKQSLRIV